MATTNEPTVTLRVPEGSQFIADTHQDGRYHLVLGLSPEVNSVVEQLALRYGSDKAEVLNRAISLLK